jgi:hypothetical protein
MNGAERARNVCPRLRRVLALQSLQMSVVITSVQCDVRRIDCETVDCRDLCGGERVSFELVAHHPLEALCNLRNLTRKRSCGTIVSISERGAETETEKNRAAVPGASQC